MTIKKKQLGAKGEDIAVRYLKRRGYRILERNYRVRLGEIDIIAKQGGDLVFIEVKTRTDSLFGSALESVTIAKQKQLSKIALEYVTKHDCYDHPSRFDVVGVQFDDLRYSKFKDAKIELVQNAFEFCHGFSNS